MFLFSKSLQRSDNSSEQFSSADEPGSDLDLDLDLAKYATGFTFTC